MSKGRQVYISEEHHKKLKMSSTLTGDDMGEIVERFIDGLDVPGWEEAKKELMT